MKVKCLIDFGEKGEKKRFIVLNEWADRYEFRKELDGTLPYDREFWTDKGEIIAGSQIISKLGGEEE